MKIVVASNSSNTRRSRLALAGRVWAPLVVAIFFGVANASFGQAPSSSDANAYSSPNAGSQPQNQSGAAQGQSQSGRILGFSGKERAVQSLRRLQRVRRRVRGQTCATGKLFGRDAEFNHVGSSDRLWPAVRGARSTASGPV